MVFKKIDSIEPVAMHIARRLTSELSDNKQVLWLVPGGSSINIAVNVSKRLESEDVRGLTVSLTDERYGPVDHSDSNWLQLFQAGFRLPDARLVPVLDGNDREKTTAKFHNFLKKQLDKADYTFGFFGIGADGHTAGILPNSPAVNEHNLAAAYDGGKFERITMTPAAIGMVDEAIVYATGEAKWLVLDQLEKNFSVNDQPAQCLKKARKLTIFNDYKGETV